MGSFYYSTGTEYKRISECKELTISTPYSPWLYSTPLQQRAEELLERERVAKMMALLQPEEITFSIPNWGWSSMIRPTKIIFNEPATIVYWTDKTKTVVKCQDGEPFDKEKGIALCYMKKMHDNKSNFNNVFKKWIKE